MAVEHALNLVINVPRLRVVVSKCIIIFNIETDQHGRFPIVCKKMFLEGGLNPKSPAGGDPYRSVFPKNVGCEFGKVGNTAGKRRPRMCGSWQGRERPQRANRSPFGIGWPVTPLEH